MFGEWGDARFEECGNGRYPFGTEHFEARALKGVAQVAPGKAHKFGAEFYAGKKMLVIAHFLTYDRGIGDWEFRNGRDGVAKGEPNGGRQSGGCAGDKAVAGRAFCFAFCADEVDIGVFGAYSEEIKSQLARVVSPLFGWRRTGVEMTESRARKGCGRGDEIARFANFVVKGIVYVCREEAFDSVFFNQCEEAVSVWRADIVVVSQSRFIFIPKIQGQVKEEKEPLIFMFFKVGFKPFPLVVCFGDF